MDKVFETVTAFKILSDPTRLRIVCMLRRVGEPKCVNEIAETVGISHSAASHQLAKLEMHEVVHSFRDGQTICYALRDNPETKKLLQVVDIYKPIHSPRYERANTR